MAWKKYAKKGKKFLNKKVVRPYATGKNARNNRLKLYKEIQEIKKVINVEKKRNVITYSTDLAIGQTIGNGAGWYCVDITPTPSQGDYNTQRNGSSIKLTGTHFNMAFKQMSATVTAIKVRIMIIKIVGVPQTAGSWPLDTYFNNTFVQSGGSSIIVDYNSEKDIDMQRGYRVLCTKNVRLPYDPTSSALVIRNIKFGLKYRNHHVRFQGNTDTVTNGQILMYIQPDAGNASSSTACTLTGVPVTAINTGANVNYNITHYYVDN